MAKVYMFSRKTPLRQLWDQATPVTRRAVKYSLPVVGDYYRNQDYLSEVARWNRDMQMHTGRTARYPMMQGKDMATAQANYYRAGIGAVKKTVNSVMSLW